MGIDLDKFLSESNFFSTREEARKGRSMEIKGWGCSEEVGMDQPSLRVGAHQNAAMVSNPLQEAVEKITGLEARVEALERENKQLKEEKKSLKEQLDACNLGWAWEERK